MRMVGSDLRRACLLIGGGETNIFSVNRATKLKRGYQT